MKIIYNKLIPFKGFYAISFFGLLFVRDEKGEKKPVSKATVNHETIHYYQQKEMLFIFFFLWYFIEWAVKLFKYGVKDNKAYYNLSFEREAYINEHNQNYLATRKPFSWWKYLNR